MNGASRMTMGVFALIFAVAATGCASSYREAAGSPEELDNREREAQATIEQFHEADPTMERFFETAAGFAVYPRVTKGGAGIGAARGQGVVYEDGEVVGYSTLTQGTVGAQLGGQTYSQIIFFETPGRLETFKRGNLELAAQASAVAASRGASADADFAEGVAVFTMGRGGLMFEASVGGQNFSFTPVDQARGNAAEGTD